jgi:hypothetical protein
MEFTKEIRSGFEVMKSPDLPAVYSLRILVNILRLNIKTVS